MTLLPIDPRMAGLAGYDPLRSPTFPRTPGFGEIQPGAMQPMQEAPFVWGQGGTRMTAEDIARARALAEQQMMTGADFSPVGHWTQGLARVAQGIVGGLGARKADRAAEANAAESASIAQMLMGGGEGGAPSGDVVAQALLNPNLDPQTRDYAKMLFQQQNTGPIEPVIQRANNGDIIGLNPMTGEEIFRNADPNPKPVLNWITATNPDGTKTLMSIGPGGPVGQALPTEPVGGLTPIEGGSVGNGTGNFR